jgi:hypothetical protein
VKTFPTFGSVSAKNITSTLGKAQPVLLDAVWGDMQFVTRAA